MVIGKSSEEDNSLLFKIIDCSYDGMLISDSQGQVQYFNEAYLRISGLKKSRIKGRKLDELVQAGEIPDACSTEVIKTHKPVSKIIEYYNGVSALVTSTPIFDSQGRLSHVFSNIRDITELIRLQEELQNSNALNDEYQQSLWQYRLNDFDETGIVAKSTTMQNLFRLATRIARVSSPVFIQGESGVGKDVLARYIHFACQTNKKRPFIHINCSAIPETLLESELFGYEPGAFTGAAKDGKRGMFELANGGTLFLDEIGEMPLSLQVKLLDVLQNNTIYRLGGTKTIKIDTRIIAATNCNIEERISQKLFRKDLYYRLNVIPIYIPPLREHKEDIVPLVLHFIELNNRKFGVKKRISPEVLDLLTAYSWPGNVRELGNVTERMLVLAESDIIDEKCLPSYIRLAITSDTAATKEQHAMDLYSLLAEVEEQIIRKALDSSGSMRKAAKSLGINLSTLVRKKKKYNIE